MSIFEYDEEKVKALWKKESFEDGLEQGRTEGLEQGRTEGLEQGRGEGKAEGIELAKTVFKFAAKKLSPEEIAERLGISAETVLEILE